MVAHTARRAAGVNADSWDALIQKWVRRILEPYAPGWKVTVRPTDELTDPESAQTLASRHTYRQGTIEYRRDAPPRNDFACHEVVHLLIAPLAIAMERAAAVLGPTGKVLDEWREDAEERTVEAITAALLKAYGED